MRDVLLPSAATEPRLRCRRLQAYEHVSHRARHGQRPCDEFRLIEPSDDRLRPMEWDGHDQHRWPRRHIAEQRRCGGTQRTRQRLTTVVLQGVEDGAEAAVVGAETAQPVEAVWKGGAVARAGASRSSAATAPRRTVAGERVPAVVADRAQRGPHQPGRACRARGCEEEAECLVEKTRRAILAPQNPADEAPRLRPVVRGRRRVRCGVPCPRVARGRRTLEYRL